MSADLALDVMDETAARRITERIRLTAHNARESLARLQDLVEQARVGNAHTALGYASWTAYLSDVFSDEPLRLQHDQRHELVDYLASEGMSVPAIATIAGVADRTVQRDLSRQGVTDVTTSSEEPPRPDPRPAKVTGLDGKQYSRSLSPAAPKAPQRRALTDQFFDAAYDLAKSIERVHRLTTDDRFPQNAEKVAAAHRNDLLRYRDLLQEAIDQLPTT